MELGIPSAVMLCLEWWAFEFMAIMAGYIGVSEQAAQVIEMNVGPILFMIAVGLRQGASKCVGNAIGEENVSKAKEYMRVSHQLAIAVILVSTSLFFIFYPQIISVFTNNKSVQRAFQSIISFVVTSILPDMWQGYLQGVVKALGIQKKVLKYNMIAYWLINVPICLFLVFYLNLGFPAIWISMNFACYYIAINY